MLAKTKLLWSGRADERQARALLRRKLPCAGRHNAFSYSLSSKSAITHFNQLTARPPRVDNNSLHNNAKSCLVDLYKM